MLNVKRLFAAGVFLSGGFMGLVAGAEQTDKASVIEQAASDLKTVYNGIPWKKIMDQGETKIKSVCSVPEQLELRSFCNKTMLPLCDKLSGPAKEALNKAILDLEKDAPVQEVVVNPKTALLISNLFEVSYFNKIKESVVSFIFQSTPELNLSKEAIDERITVAIKGFIQKNLKDVEILNLISFIQKSKGIKKVVDNVAIFKKIITENLSPEIAEKFQRFCA